MSWQFGRINLCKTDYTACGDWIMLKTPPVDELLRIYRDYCRHKHFLSVIPMVPERFTEAGTDVIGYQHQGKLVAWSMLRRWGTHSVLSDHFAWDYRDPALRLGIHSLETECAIYRDRGFQWMYFESVEPYMLDITGFEILGAHE
jgi:hypothetical protein